MEERELGAAVRPVQGKDIIPDDWPHTVTFADFCEKLLDESYGSVEKAYLNKIFMERDKELRPRRGDGKSSSRTILSILTNEYEQFIFDTMKRKMEEQNAKVLFNGVEQDEDKNH